MIQGYVDRAGGAMLLRAFEQAVAAHDEQAALGNLLRRKGRRVAADVRAPIAEEGPLAVRADHHAAKPRRGLGVALDGGKLDPGPACGAQRHLGGRVVPHAGDQAGLGAEAPEGYRNVQPRAAAVPAQAAGGHVVAGLRVVRQREAQIDIDVAEDGNKGGGTA